MSQCEVCGTQNDLPFTCNECGMKLCGDHRLPEAHSCAGLASENLRFGEQSGRTPEPTRAAEPALRGERKGVAGRLKRLAMSPVRAVGSLFR